MPRKISQEIKSYENGLIKQNLFYLFFSFFCFKKKYNFYELCIWKNFALGKMNVDEEIYV